MELKELTNRIISRKRIISALLILIMAFTAFWIYSETLSFVFEGGSVQPTDGSGSVQ